MLRVRGRTRRSYDYAHSAILIPDYRIQYPQALTSISMSYVCMALGWYVICTKHERGLSRIPNQS